MENKKIAVGKRKPKNERFEIISGGRDTYRDDSEYGGGVGGPLDVANCILEIERHDGSRLVGLPQLDRPVGGTRKEDLGRGERR